ncbi:MAG: peptidylprolyl isomerase, partial [Planctomycetaceae bacterium]
MRGAFVRVMVVAVSAVLAVGTSASAQEGTKPEGDKKPSEPKAAETKPAPAGGNPKAKIDTTLGVIVVELDAAKAPITVENFVQYA